MVKIIFLTVDGNLGDGLEMSLQICETSGTLPIVPVPEKGRLNPNPELQEYYEFWLNAFITLRSHRARGDNFDNWEVDEAAVTGRSTFTGEDACREFVRLTEENFKTWLSESGDRHWISIRETLIEELVRHPDDISIIIQAKQTDLWKLPWYAWDLLERYPNVGISFSFSSGQRVNNFSQIQPKSFTGNKVRILVVLGSDRGIDLDPDKQAILDLAQADPHFLSKPTAQQLNQTLRDKQGWDIFLFAGHSESDKYKERIYISEHEFVEITDFKNSLREAISHGLKVAIFNSCQGMGLAERLADLHLPFSIVMQEPVPDRIAQAFLKEFLTEYSQGKLLYTAVRIATQRLEDFNQKWPGATWLPIICQNPTELPPSWQELLKDSSSNKIPDVIPEDNRPDLPEIPEPSARKTSPFAKNWRRRLQTVVVTSLLMTGLVLGIQSFGLLQQSELNAYDRLMRMRPPEPMDDRLVIIKVTEADYKELGTDILTDEIVASLLEKISQFKPRIIGINLSQISSNVSSNYEISRFIDNHHRSNIIFACATEGLNHQARYPLAEVSQDYLGFTDLAQDYFDDVIRRQVIGQGLNENSPCPIDKSFSLQIAKTFLKIEKQDRKSYQPLPRKNNQVFFGDVLLKKLRYKSGGYNFTIDKIDDFDAHQIMINYRAFSQIADTLTVAEVFNSSNLQLSNVRDRIVLIGNYSQNKDAYLTPYSVRDPHSAIFSRPKMSGVEIHAHMISQLLSAELDGRPLIQFWPEWLESFWIWLCSLLGGIIVLWNQRFFPILFLATISVTAIYASCFALLLIGYWVPALAPIMALLITAATVKFYQSKVIS